MKRRGIIAGVSAVVIAAIVWFFPVLTVGEIEVEGNEHQNTSEIIAQSAVEPGQNMLRVDNSDVAKRVAGLNWIKQVTVQKKWPRTIHIEVTERVAVMHAGGDLIDSEGKRFHSGEVPDTALEAVGRGIEDPEVAKAVGQLEPDILRQLDRVEAPTPQEMTFYTDDGREIYWGSPELAHDKARATRVVLQRDGRHWNVSNPQLVTVR